MIINQEKKQELIESIKQGKKVFFLETENSGHDEWLIMDDDQTEKDLKTDICYFHGIEEFPSTWELVEMNLTDIELEA